MSGKSETKALVSAAKRMGWSEVKPLLRGGAVCVTATCKRCHIEHQFENANSIFVPGGIACHCGQLDWLDSA